MKSRLLRSMKMPKLEKILMFCLFHDIGLRTDLAPPATTDLNKLFTGSVYTALSGSLLLCYHTYLDSGDQPDPQDKYITKKGLWKTSLLCNKKKNKKRGQKEG